MSKLMYLVPIPLDAGEQDGVLKKIIMQYSVFSEQFNTCIIGYYRDGVGVLAKGEIRSLTGRVSRRIRRFALYKTASEYARKNNIGNIYIRFGYCDVSLINMLKRLRKNGSMKICIEIPTFPYDVEMRRKSIKYRFLGIIDKATRSSLKKYVDKIYTFSEDTKVFGIPAVHIINGLDFKNISVRKHCKTTDGIRLIAVSTMGFNHGYDRMLKGLRSYYDAHHKEKVYFDLVGDGAEKQWYREMIKNYHLEDFVTLHGFKNGAELDALFDGADIAIASLGMHRANIYLASTLKTREYGAKGLPIVTSCRIDIYDEEWEYLLNIDADDSPVDICVVVRFYHSVYDAKDVNDVSNEIRSYTEKKCEIHRAMEVITDYYKEK